MATGEAVNSTSSNQAVPGPYKRNSKMILLELAGAVPVTETWVQSVFPVMAGE